jgi:hypothetical protein
MRKGSSAARRKDLTKAAVWQARSVPLSAALSVLV